MKIAIILTQSSQGSAGTFERIHEISVHLKKENIDNVIFSPIESDEKNISDISFKLIPTTFSKLNLSKFTYNFIRKVAASKYTSPLFLSKRSIEKMISNLEKGLEKSIDFHQFDILHAVQPLAASACISISKKLGIPLVSELNNIWPEELVSNGLIKKNDETYIRLKQLEQNIIDNSNLIHVVSDFMKDYLIEHYETNPKSIIVVPAAGTIFNESKNLSRNDNVVYAGMVNPRSHVDLFVNSIPHVKNLAKFFITNKGDDLSRIKKISSNQKPDVNYFWFNQRKKVLSFLSQSKIGIATFHNDITWKLGIPLKPFDYLSCGLPIVINEVDNWWSKIIREENIGLTCTDNPIDMAEKIDTILNDSELWLKMHKNCLNIILKKYNWNIVTKDILVPTYSKISS